MTCILQQINMLIIMLWSKGYWIFSALTQCRGGGVTPKGLEKFTFLLPRGWPVNLEGGGGCMPMVPPIFFLANLNYIVKFLSTWLR